MGQNRSEKGLIEQFDMEKKQPKKTEALITPAMRHQYKSTYR